MPQEIERKFLVLDDAWRTAIRASHQIRQGYITPGPPFSVRIRTMDSRAFITIKSTGEGLVRSEYDYEIPATDAAELLNQACAAPLIEKIRHVVDWAGLEWTVDEFENPHKGLVLAEIELATPEQTIQPPPWAGREVTDDPAYRNSRLAGTPVKS